MKTYFKAASWIPVAGIIASSAVHANDSFNAELGHFVGSGALASATTVVVDKYAPKVKRPALTGFAFGASVAVIGEAVDRATGGRFSMLDVVVGTAGAAVGAYATDQWYIAPKLNIQKGETTCGVVATHRF